ncbi:AAA family ATPase [Streptomyces sp. NBC_01601]|uniref:AAA family ATPase n=1 Tax=Streptomyces sp. NBC_01601 TaxID=2975892 RepID=UPI002E28F12D|nr:AAA family ATPase [Streptomyces sp. NBC_01601]
MPHQPDRYLLPEDVLNLPNALILMLGAPGSGKTRTSRMFPPDIVLRADDLRTLCAGDPGSQEAEGPVWQALDTILTARLSLGLRTTIDATNAEKDHRQKLVLAGRSHGAPVVALVMGTAPSVAQTRNAARPANRQVPADITADLHAQIVAAHPYLNKEGFDYVVFAESLPVLGTALERLAQEERAAEPIADVHRVFGAAAAELFDWETPSRDPRFRTGVFGAGGESLRVRWMDDADPFDIRFEAIVSCPTDWCPGPAWTPVRSVYELAAAHRNSPLDDSECARCDS